MGTHRKHPSGRSTAKARRANASSTATSISKGRDASNKALLEPKDVTAAEDHKQADPTASSQQEVPTASSSQEAPQHKRPEIKPPAESPAAFRQEEAAAPARKDDQDEQPTPPRIPAAPGKTRPLPERMLYERQMPAAPPPAPAPGPAEPSGPTARLTDIDWMPPAEDQVARFLTSMADIAPPPVREREGNRAPGFFLPSAISSGETERKKAKAEPFWSQVVATPMEQPASLPPTRPRRATRKLWRTGKGRLMLIGGILVLLILALAIFLLIHAGLLHK